MNNLSKFVLGMFAAVVLGMAGLATAQIYVGYNPTSGLQGIPGVPVAVGPIPALGASTSCGTTSVVGGSGVFQVTAGATTCTIQVVIPSAAPNGVYCVFIDETTPADTLHQVSHTTTSCTSNAATVASADKILIEINGF